MKRILFASVIMGMLLLQSCIYGDWNNGVSGNGNVLTETIDVDDFTGVHASAGIDVLISQGDFSVELEADENLHEYIYVERRGDILEIGSERNIYRAEAKLVRVSLPELEEIKISSAGDIDALTDFECEDLRISISSAGDLKIGVTARNVDIGISSSGDCDIWGRAESLEATLSSAGDLNAYDLETDFARVRVSSAGDAKIRANKEVDLGASSAGSIYYKGDAKVVHSSTSSAGSIVHKN